MYCSPCSPARLLVCDTIASGIMAIISTLILTLIAIIFFGYTMTGNVMIYLGLWFLTMISMFSIGLTVASLCRTTKSMNIVTSLLYFPMLLFSGATIPAEIFPKGLRFFADILPLGVGINLLKSASIGQYENIILPIIILSFITAICTFIAVKFFKWE